MASTSKGLTKTHDQQIPSITDGVSDGSSSSKSTATPRRYVAPKSPHTLLQEDLEGDPWKILVCCVMLNCTTRKQMESVMWEFFRLWPTPEEFLKANTETVAELIKSLGFKNRRAERLRRMSEEWIALVATTTSTHSAHSRSHTQTDSSSISTTSTASQTSSSASLTTVSPTGETVPSGEAVRQVHGVGEYAARAYEIFCLGKAGDEPPVDHALVKYWCWMTGTPLPEELK